MFKLKGAIPPMLTPFNEHGEIDVYVLEKLIDFLKDKVHGLFINGSYGSGAMMSIEERKKVAEITVKRVGGAITVVNHVGTTNTKHSVELAKHAEAIGCDAVSSVGPYYYKHTDDAICGFFTALKQATKLPVYLYHNPGFSGYEITEQTISNLCNEGVINGIKDATFNIITHATYHRRFGSKIDIVLGTEAMLLAASPLGTKAFIPGLANAFPEICVKLYNEAMDGNYEEARITQFIINEMREIMYLAKSTQLAIYAMLSIRGIIKSYPRAPFIPASSEEVAAIRSRLQALGVI